jgi:CopG antitoxin of type II toxin-antitoxin system
MAGSSKKRDKIPDRFASIEEFTDFWDKHDITDYPDVWRETNLKVNLVAEPNIVALDPELAKRLEIVARAKRTTVKRLVNRWLEERLRTA